MEKIISVISIILALIIAVYLQAKIVGTSILLISCIIALVLLTFISGVFSKIDTEPTIEFLNNAKEDFKKGKEQSTSEVQGIFVNLP